jgi:hypothetical protein
MQSRKEPDMIGINRIVVTSAPKIDRLFRDLASCPDSWNALLTTRRFDLD